VYCPLTEAEERDELLSLHHAYGPEHPLLENEDMGSSRALWNARHRRICMAEERLLVVVMQRIAEDQSFDSIYDDNS
jgi:hypothetical protein